MDVERAFEIVGTCGRYQFFLVFLLFLSNFSLSMQMVLMVVVGATPNMNQSSEQELTTIVTDFALYEKQWVVELMQSVFMAGYMIGCSGFGQVSDTFGRKKVVISCLGLAGSFGILSGLVQSWKTFAVTRFFTGLFVGGLVSTFTLMMEIIGPGAWKWAGMVYQSFFSMGMMCLAGLAYWLLHWRTICVVVGSLLFLQALVYAFVLPESPRWLYSSGRIHEAQAVMRKLAYKNGKSNSTGIILTEVESANDKEETKNNFIDIFRHRKLTVWLFANALVWFCCALVYYGLTMSASDLTPNLYFGVLLSGAVEIPGGLLCIYFLGRRRFGRKGTILITFIVCFIACIGMTIKPEGNVTWRLGFGLTAKLAVSAAFNILYVYGVEIFPTSLRSVSLGVSSTVGRIGAIVAPFVTLLHVSHASLPYLIFTIACCVSAISTYFLPRTLGYVVPQSIEEALDRKPVLSSNETDEIRVALLEDDDQDREA